MKSIRMWFPRDGYELQDHNYSAFMSLKIGRHTYEIFWIKYVVMDDLDMPIGKRYN